MIVFERIFAWLMSVIMLIMPGGMFNTEEDLSSTIDSVEESVGFSTDVFDKMVFDTQSESDNNENVDFSTASVQTGTCGENLTWTLYDNGELVISGSGPMYNYILEDGSPWESYANSVKSVIILDGVTTIGDYAFFSCTSLTSVTIGNSVNQIGGRAFCSCINITDVIISESVVSIGTEAFACCSSLTNISIGDGVTSIGSDAFLGCDKLTSVIIGHSVTSIGADAFAGCETITNVYYTGDIASWCAIRFSSSYAQPMRYGENFYVKGKLLEGELRIPDGVTSIGSSSFECFSGITSVIIPDSVTSIGAAAFLGCKYLEKVTIGNSVTTIGDAAFNGCSGLTELTMPISTEIYNSSDTFGECTNIEKITLTEGDGTAQNYSSSTGYSNICYEYTPWYISGCSEIVIEDGVTSIGDCTFYNCSGIKELTMPISTKIYNSSDTFGGCTNIEKITLTKGDGTAQSYSNSIAIDLFATKTNYRYTPWYISDCSEIVIKDGVAVIGNYTFYNCTELNIVHYLGNSSQLMIASNAFSGTSAEIHDCTLVATISVCTQNGTGDWYCAVCDKNIVSGVEVSAPGHDWSNRDGVCARENCGYECEHPEDAVTWEIVVEPTCVPGLKRGFCSICEISGEKTIVCDSSTYPESPHSYSNSYNNTWTFSYNGAKKLILKFSSSTETENNYDYIFIYNSAGTQIGKYCGTQLSGKEIELEGSSFQIKLTSDSSQTKYGFKFDSITAIVDGAAIEREIPSVSDHDWSNKDGVCANGCGNTCLTVGHSFGEWQVTTAPTCSETGVETKSCSQCDVVETRSVDALGHSYGSWITETPATCTEEGLKYKVCSVCSDRVNETIEPVGHSYVVEVIDPTCTEEGYTVHHCNNCDDEYTDNYVSATGHNYGSWITETPATCTKDGLRYKICDTCSDCVEEVIVPNGHSFIEEIVPPTQTDEGCIKHTCTVCDYEYTEPYQEKPQVIVSSASAEVGEVVDITVSILNNPGIIATSLKFNYDTSSLKLISVTNENLFAGGNFLAGKDLSAVPYTVMWEDSVVGSNYTDNGIFVTLKFEVLSTAKSGKNVITVIADEGSIFNYDIEDVDFNLVNGYIEITQDIPGDADGDGVITLKDVTNIRKYLAGDYNMSVDISNADVDGDDEITLKDAVLIKRYLAGGWGVTLI